MIANVSRTENDFDVRELYRPNWETANEVRIGTYWSGEAAPSGRHFAVRLLWSDAALYVRFVANQNEPIVVSAPANIGRKTIGLWDRDVCEIFIAPDLSDPTRYFEFEVSPNGEWLDLGVHQLPDRRETDWDYSSGMECAAEIRPERVVMAVKIPWDSIGSRPSAGDCRWGNLLRCVGTEPGRGYLAWSPTFTEKPNFHVPARFGTFRFLAAPSANFDIDR